MKLYEISKEFLALEELWESSINLETGEIQNCEVLEELETIIKEMLKNKAENIIKYIRNEEASIKAIKEEEERLAKLRKDREKKINNFKEYIKNNMQIMKENSITTNVGSIKLRNSQSTVIDERFIQYDPRYATKETVYKYDKRLIKDLLQKGETIRGASIQNNLSINIK